MRWLAGLLLLGLAGCSDRAQQPVPGPPAAASRAVALSSASGAVAVAEPVPVEAPAAKLVMDVMQVVGKSEAEVAALLGEPASCEAIHRARMCSYPRGDEVMFVAGKADMITVQRMGEVRFDEAALVALGLAPAKPDHADEDGIRWESLPGLHEVTLFPGPGNSVRYAYVKVGSH